MYNGIDVDNLVRILDKIKMYDREFVENFNDFRKVFIQISDLYDSYNYGKMVEVHKEIIDKFEVVKVNNSNNEKIISETVIKYVSTAQSVAKKFSEINVAGD